MSFCTLKHLNTIAISGITNQLKSACFGHNLKVVFNVINMNIFIQHLFLLHGVKNMQLRGFCPPCSVNRNIRLIEC